MKITIDNFQGIAPKIADDKLPIGGAQTAENTRIDGGDVRAYNNPLYTAALSSSAYVSLFRFYENLTNHWVALTDNVQTARSPMAQDTYERMYIFGQTEPRVYANDIVSATFDPTTDYYKLGITAPTTALTVERSGSTERYYTYTFINTYGEEGPPLTPVGGTDVNDSTPTLTTIHACPASRRIAGIRVYRTASGTDGTASYRFVCEATYFSTAVAYDEGDYVIYSATPNTDSFGLFKCTSTHAAGAWNASHFTAGDAVADADLGSVLTTTYYDPPPTGLKGVVLHPGGFLVGFKGNEVYLSASGLPYAWPESYRKTVEGTIVGLGIIGDTIVVLTDGYPYLFTGTYPDQMTKNLIPRMAPCLKKESIVSNDEGVFYASREGLMRVYLVGIENVTQDVFRPDQWASYYPETMHGQFYYGKYFGWYSSTTSGGIIIDFVNKNVSTTSLKAYAGYISTDGKYYLIVDDETNVGNKCIKEWEGDPYNYLTGVWKSGKIILPARTTFTAGRVFLDSGFYDDCMALQESNDYILNQNATLYDQSTPSITGTSATFIGEAGDTIKVTLNGIAYDDIDVSYCTDTTTVASLINAAIGTTRATTTDDDYLKIMGGINMYQASIADGTSTGQAVVHQLFPSATGRAKKSIGLGGSLNACSVNTRSINSNTISNVDDLDINNAVAFKLYGDDEEKFSKTITSDDVFRITNGARIQTVEIQSIGNIPIRKIEIGTSITELVKE